MLERMIGVEHGAIGEFNTLKEPSNEVLEILSQLPRASRVGLEALGEDAPPELLEKFYSADGYYFDRIKEECDKLGLEVVPLDDVGVYKKIDRISKKQRKLERKRNRTLSDLRQNYSYDIQIRHASFIERDEYMKRKIIEANPSLIILGAGHIFPLITDYDFLSSFEGEVQADYDMNLNRNPVIRDLNLIRRYGKAAQQNSFVDGRDISVLMREIMLDRELLRRKYNAVMGGRIDMNSQPSFVGTFDLAVPARGLFEVFQSGKSFSGGIVDVHGDSEYSGEIKGDEVEFTKRYVRSDGSVFAGDLTYTAQKEQGLYRGRVDLKNGLFLPFIMIEGSDTSPLMNYGAE